MTIFFLSLFRPSKFSFVTFHEGVNQKNILIILILRAKWLMVSFNKKQWFSQYTYHADPIKMASFVYVLEDIHYEST